MQGEATTAMGALRSLATTQVQCDIFSDQIIQSVKSGETDPLEVLVQIRAFERAADRILKELRDNFITAANKYPGNTFELAGNKLEKAEAGVVYNYAATGDPVWSQCDAIANTAIERRKEREAFLRAVKEPVTIVDEGTGEIIKIVPPPKKSTTTIKVTIK